MWRMLSSTKTSLGPLLTLVLFQTLEDATLHFLKYETQKTLSLYSGIFSSGQSECILLAFELMDQNEAKCIHQEKKHNGILPTGLQTNLQILHSYLTRWT